MPLALKIGAVSEEDEIIHARRPGRNVSLCARTLGSVSNALFEPGRDENCVACDAQLTHQAIPVTEAEQVVAAVVGKIRGRDDCVCSGCAEVRSIARITLAVEAEMRLS